MSTAMKQYFVESSNGGDDDDEDGEHGHGWRKA